MMSEHDVHERDVEGCYKTLLDDVDLKTIVEEDDDVEEVFGSQRGAAGRSRGFRQ